LNFLFKVQWTMCGYSWTTAPKCEYCPGSHGWSAGRQEELKRELIATKLEFGMCPGMRLWALEERMQFLEPSPSPPLGCVLDPQWCHQIPLVKNAKHVQVRQPPRNICCGCGGSHEHRRLDGAKNIL
jgi:hypothetical protein